MSESKSTSIGSKLKEVGSHSIIYGLGSMAQSAAGLLLLPILTGALSKDDFGVYSMIVMASTIASAVFYLGITSALPRSYFDYASNEDRRAVFTTAFIILALGAVIQTLLGYYFGSTISKLLVRNSSYGDAVAWAFLGSSMGFINQYFFNYLRILRKSISSVVFSLISFIATIGLTLLLLHELPGSLIAPFQAIVCSQIIVMIIILIMYGKTAFIFKFKRNEVSKLVLFGGPIVVASFGLMIIDSVDRIIIERTLTLADVGAYSAVLKVAALINVLMIVPFTQIWSPMMMEYRSHSNIKDLFSRVLSVFLIVGGIILVGAALFAAEILSLLIQSGVNSAMISSFLIITLGTLIYGTTNILAAGLFYERKVFQSTYIYCSVATLKIGVSLLLIPLFGITGAAASTLFAYILIPVGIYALARRYFSFNIDWRKLFVLGMICFLPIIYGLVFSEKYHFDFSVRLTWFTLTLYLIFLNCFSKDERIGIKKMLSYRIVK
ncbi:MAG: oligosaccharide flippase family protein [Rhodoferax sp.]|nr:oligosaccharide flippase family protein [Rhodoferax sp.]MDP1531512.1 oligosaccharide flippase family protein [Rhodoferax sp.]MDP1942950.1 oligosaccharide flippase family protein [Rhodoferax sp.]